jgi:hypothetical protein
VISNGGTWAFEQEVATTLHQQQQEEYGAGGLDGCMNPAFVDDDDDGGDGNGKDKGGGGGGGGGSKAGSDGKLAKSGHTKSISKNPNHNSNKSASSATTQSPKTSSADKKGGGEGETASKMSNGKAGQGHLRHDFGDEQGQESAGNALQLLSSSADQINSGETTTDQETNVDEIQGQGQGQEEGEEVGKTTTCVQIHSDISERQENSR